MATQVQPRPLKTRLRNAAGPQLRSAQNVPIRQLPFLRTLDPRDQHMLERMLHVVAVEAGKPTPSVLKRPGQLYVLRRGRIALIGDAPNGQRMMIGLLEPGDIYSTLGGIAAPDAIAFEDAAITPLHEQGLRALAQRYPQVGVDLGIALSERIAMLRDVVVCVGQMHTDDRLWSRIVMLTESMGVATPEGAQLRLPLTHGQWAQLTGASRESVTLAFGRLKRAGRLTVEGRTITIPWESLEERSAKAANA